MKTILFLLFPGLTTARSNYQSGPHDGAVYAASMVVNGESVYWTGITYDSKIDDRNLDGSILSEPDCFVASVRDTNSSLEFNLLSTYGVDESIAQTCRGIAMLSDQQLVVVGTSDPGGLFTGGTTQTQVGFGMTVSTSDLSLIAGSSLFSDAEVPYPQAIVIDPNDSDSIYVASMTGNDDTPMDGISDEFPNWTHLFKHGQTFEMTIERLQYTVVGTGSSAIDDLLGGDSSASTKPTIQTVWSQPFPVEPSADGTTKTVYVGGMIFKQDVGLIVAGSTAALGNGYGPAEGDDDDGYVTILDPSTGQLKSTGINNQRFGTAEYDIVTSICDDPDDPTNFYIVGSTEGDIDGTLPADTQPLTGSLQAFIKKVNVDSLTGVWTVQHGAWGPTNDSVTKVIPWGCVVSNNVVYMAGEVMEGAGLIEGSEFHTTKGGDDIFVIQYDKTAGSVNWMQQVGSSGNDHIARGGGIKVDQVGNAIVFGDTTGPLYRDRAVSSAADLFEITFEFATGAFPVTQEGDDVRQTLPISDGVSETPDSTSDATDANVDLTDATEDPTDGETETWDPTADLGAADEAVVPLSRQAHQSGPNPGAIFASGLVYDPISDQAVVVGLSYTSMDGLRTEVSGCLIARIEIGSMETKTYNILGDNDVLEACRGIAMVPGTDLLSSTIVVVGNSEPGSLYYGDDGQDVLQTGFGMSLTGDELSVQKVGSLLSDLIPYPQAVEVDGDSIYVTSMTSNDLQQNANNPIAADFPNWTYLNKYGKGFTMTIEKLTLPNFESVWSNTYPVDPEADGSIFSVHVGGLILKRTASGDVLVVVGSTRAKGPAYGPAVGDDTDGFITLVDPSTGELLSGRANNMRVGSEADDVVSEVCDVPGEDNAIIVVGATKGDVDGVRDDNDWNAIPDDSLMWFAMKINIDTLEEVWSIQGGALRDDENIPTSTYAVGCHVSGEIIYVGGTVENGAKLLNQGTKKQAKGGNDVWVAQLNLVDGSSNWIQQIGSAGDDQLARNGGIVTDKDGDVLVFGDTTGAFYRERVVGSNADIFLAVLTSSTGDFAVKGTSAPDSGPEADIPEMQPTTAPVAPEIYQKEVTATGETIPDNIIAIQLGPDVGPSYAGGMDYDSDTNSIYLTGATFGAFSGPGVRPTKASSCFFSRIDLPALEVIQRDKYGVDARHDACTAISANSFGGQQNAIVIGATEYGGLLTELAEKGSRQHGFAIDLSLQHKFEFLGGSIVGVDPVAYPVALVADEENFWTVSMVSQDARVSPDFDKVQHDEYPNFTNGGVDKYGTEYKMSVERFKYIRTGDGDPFAQGAAKSFESEWAKTVALGDEHEGMFVSGMITVGDLLLVVGTVRSEGILDGFIAKINREDGTTGESDSSGEYVNYVEAQDESDSWLMNACADPEDPDFFYVVGATQSKWDGTIKTPKNPNKRPVHAFAAKISTADLEMEWLARLELDDKKGQTAAAAYGCDVLSTDKILYVAGTVENGARMRDAQVGRGVAGESAGGDDIFVAQISTLNGQLRWLKQAGSTGDDRLARGGGIKVDKNGNAIVYGDTSGDFFRRRNDGTDKKERYSDIFLMLFDKHYGIHQPPLSGPKIKSKGSPSEFFNEHTKNPPTTKRIIGLIVLVVVILGLVYFVYRRYCRRSRKEPISIYDAAAADLSYHEDTSKSSSFGLSLFNDDPDKGILSRGSNLNYRDDPDGDDNNQGGLTGGFHKTFSDLPQSGKEII